MSTRRQWRSSRGSTLSAGSERLLEELGNHISELHAEWKTLLELFARDDETAKLLLSTASSTFDTLYRTLVRDVILGIARITDPLQTAGKDNLVLARLRELPEVVERPSLLTDLDGALATVQDAAKAFRRYRNEYLAHLDLQTSLSPTSSTLPIKRDEFEAVLAAIAGAYNVAYHALRDAHFAFKDVALMGGPKALLKALRESRSWRALPAKLRQGLAAKHPAQPL